MDSLITVWSSEALQDVDDIAEYITKDSKFYASSVVEKIISSTRILKKFPKIGRIVPEFEDENIREIFVYDYRLVYHILSNKILIVTVIHGKRKLM
ncbi:MAG: addiction module antitoxin [uncultured bacterium]|nr:MAG: addiction module antitoxin [uncultured bacterium]